ncbi:peptidase M14 [Lacinutrix sp. C3R15]|uniref:M14 family zinc carboxypeptidase n=1 Tax=Flavobacteriaceae TaxID=49546 RepID=UPI001C09D1F6|nr:MULTISPECIES: M14 family zinc carboxypeptidase [Flavobacteriaceae]MBU2938641.1 peptidase M14 [Lacinutrix sp. C3R15]MDO6621955.1 M14 family zinc carboxypeptidase [Oceanihabitans sp. 1_MG-2023]
MQIEFLKTLFTKHKEEALYHRYIHLKDIAPLLKKLESECDVSVIGKSVLNQDIHTITIGNGPKKILMWSQMHGNESTTTKAVFDLLNLLISQNEVSNAILNTCTIKIIPILNPDGAKAYTRINANEVDLNRDAQNLTQPESIVLKDCFERFKPHFCYNLHGQRTIFSAGNTSNLATVSFLAPAQDPDCLITDNRKRAMELIAVMNANLQQQIPNQVGIYDDAFNINCVGDTFQTYNVPTVLFEAGHYSNDYAREVVREYIFQSLVVSLNYIANNTVSGDAYASYLHIPENQKLFYDVIIKNARVVEQGELVDITVQYQERLQGESVVFVPKIEKITKANSFYAHKSYDAKGSLVFTIDNEIVFEGYENDLVILNNEKLSLKLIES